MTWFASWLRREYPAFYRLLLSSWWRPLVAGLVALPIWPLLYWRLFKWASRRAPGETVPPARLDTHLEAATVLVDLTHVVALALVLVFLFPRLRSATTRPRREIAVSPSVAYFHRFVLLLTLSWLGLYVLRLAFALIELPFGVLPEIVLPLLNLLGSLALFCMYVVLITAPDGQRTRVVQTRPFPFGLLAIASGVLITLFGAFSIAPDADAVAATIDGGLLGDFRWLFLAHTWNGFLAAVATALVVGRLDSKYIGLKPWMITAFFSYAVIQVLYPYLELPGYRGLELVLVVYALLAKLLFLLALAYIIDSRFLQFYFQATSWLDKHVRWLRDGHTGETRAERGARAAPWGLLSYTWKLKAAEVVESDGAIYFEIALRNFGIGDWYLWSLSGKSVRIEKVSPEELERVEKGIPGEEAGERFALSRLEVEGLPAEQSIHLPDSEVLRGEASSAGGVPRPFRVVQIRAEVARENRSQFFESARSVTGRGLSRKRVLLRFEGLRLLLSRVEHPKWESRQEWYMGEAIDGTDNLLVPCLVKPT